MWSGHKENHTTHAGNALMVCSEEKYTWYWLFKKVGILEKEGKLSICKRALLRERPVPFLFFFFVISKITLNLFIDWFNLFFYFRILYWFCHTLTWIHHGCTCVPHPEPPSHLPPQSIPLGYPSAPAPSTLYHASNLGWRFVSHVIIYMFQFHSPISSHSCPLPQSPKDCSIHLCLFCCLAYRVIITIFLNSIYMC